MKKIILLMGFVLISAFGFAQKFNTKKGVLYLDKKEIAKVSDKRGLYTFSDLEGTERLKIKMEIVNLSGLSRKIFYTVSLPDDSKTVLIGSTTKNGSMSGEKRLFFDFFEADHKVLTTEGIDMNEVEALFNTDQTELTALVETYKDYGEEAKRAEKIFKDSGFSFNDLGEFGRKVNGSFKTYGSLKRKSGFVNQYIYEVYDTKGVLKAVYNNDNLWHLVFTNGGSYYINQFDFSPSASLNMDKGAAIVLGFVLDKDPSFSL